MPRRIVLHAMVLACAALAPACARDPAEELCPEGIGAGDLVITEVRAQQANDDWGQWVELYNATGATVDLEGAEVAIDSIDGSKQYRILIRRPLALDAGDYLVVGVVGDQPAPEHIDYVAGNDLEGDMPESGGVTVSACGVELDSVIFEGLPDAGTYSLGASPPSAEANDLADAWCTDSTPSTDPTKIGLPGTPGAENIPCTP